LFELWYGVAKSSRREFNRKRLETFLAGPVHPLPFEDGDAEIAGAIRADLESVGKPIGAYDLLMAGQSMRNKLTLITANVREFARIKTLAWVDWGKP
jgi:tRNA(fMet)-specific endonuclease VapC